MKLFIKYMVSIRCKLIVKSELERLGIRHGVVQLGEVEIPEGITRQQREELAVALDRTGLKLIEDRKAILIERIKNVIIETIHYSEESLKVNFSHYLSEKLNYSYTYLSNLFSEVENTTIEHFIIKHKIERVKELMVYDELSLTEIAYQMHYSSVAHLSYQFKRVTGLTPTFFKHLKDKRLNGLDEL